jgi:hypothetical protein
VAKFVRVTPSALDYIADNMRDEDAAEVRAYGHNRTLREALQYSVDTSEFNTVFVAPDGTPLCVFGLKRKDVLTGTGVPWLLSSKDMLRYKRHFMIHGPGIIEAMFTYCKRLENYVHDKNTHSVAWLKRLGFTIHTEPAVTPHGETFYKFTMESASCVNQPR